MTKNRDSQDYPLIPEGLRAVGWRQEIICLYNYEAKRLDSLLRSVLDFSSEPMSDSVALQTCTAGLRSAVVELKKHPRVRKYDRLPEDARLAIETAWRKRTDLIQQIVTNMRLRSVQ
ncbi:MAG: hypothetical protein WCI89_00940 [bacterium]